MYEAAVVSACSRSEIIPQSLLRSGAEKGDCRYVGFYRYHDNSFLCVMELSLRCQSLRSSLPSHTVSDSDMRSEYTERVGTTRVGHSRFNPKAR